MPEQPHGRKSPHEVEASTCCPGSGGATIPGESSCSSEQDTRERARCICGCGQRAVHRHHVVYAQAVEREGGDVTDARNLVPVAFSCHGAHHGRSRPFELRMLPDSVFEFARELLGAYGADYLRRRYAGDDPRLNGLLG
jgi:hypothetical protein